MVIINYRFLTTETFEDLMAIQVKSFCSKGVLILWSCLTKIQGGAPVRITDCLMLSNISSVLRRRFGNKGMKENFELEKPDVQL